MTNGNSHVELWLVRHGQSTHSAAQRVAGWSDPPLTDIGRLQSRSLRSFLDGAQFAGVWASDLSRASETAVLAWGEATRDARLRECNFGPLEGHFYDDVDAEHGEVFERFRDFEVAGGESHGTFRDRIVGFVDELVPGRHLLFVHGGVIRVLTQDLGLDRFLSTCGVAVVDWSGRRLLAVHERRE